MSQRLITGPMGSMRVDPAKYAEMTRDGQWTLDSFEFKDVDVVFPNADTAVIAYKVHQTGSMKGKPMDLNAADSTVWARNGGEWKCALHTETMLENQRQPGPRFPRRDNPARRRPAARERAGSGEWGISPAVRRGNGRWSGLRA